MSIEQEKMIVESLSSLYPLQEFEEKAIHTVLDALPPAQLGTNLASLGTDLISRQAAIDAFYLYPNINWTTLDVLKKINEMPTIQPDIVRCKDCKWWRQQTNYQGAPLSFGFCESDDMWRSLYGETNEVAHIDTDDDFYCGYAERRTDE